MLWDCQTRKDDDGTETVILLVGLDRSEQIRAEAGRDKEQRKLRTLFDALTEVIIFKGGELRYVVCNQKFCDFYGLPKEETIGKTDFA